MATGLCLVLFAAPCVALADPFELLGISTGATLREIRSAYRARARELHPDVSQLPADVASERFRGLVQALDDAQQHVARSPAAPRLQSPADLSEDERIDWLIDHNRVILFMRGTKQRPLDADSSTAVAALSITAFDAEMRFAACDVDADQALGDAVARRADGRPAPVCFIDSRLVGGAVELLELYEEGELLRLFGGERAIDDCPPELLEWRGGTWRPPEEWEDRRRQSRREQRRAPVADAAAAELSELSERDGGGPTVLAYRWFKGSEQWQMQWRARGEAGVGEEELSTSWERWAVVQSAGGPVAMERAERLRRVAETD